MTERIIKSFAELHEAIQSLSNSHPIFRGEDNTAYELRSKIGRYMVKNSKNDLDTEKQTLKEFKRCASPFLSAQPSNDWDWLALAQHHDLPTRLLDWTENPLVAAYFAVNNPVKKSDSAIYVCQRFKLQTADENLSPFQLTEDVIFNPKHSSARIVAQRGLFTVQHNPKNKFSHNTLEKWILKKDCLANINVTLDRYGINEASLFPGLDGLSHHITKWYFWG